MVHTGTHSAHAHFSSSNPARTLSAQSNLVAHAPFSFCLSTDVPPVQSTLEPPGTCPIQLQQSHQGSPMKNDQGPPACTHYNSSQPVKASRHMQSKQENFPIQVHSFREEVVVSPNSYKETQKSKKMRRQKYMIQTKKQDKTSEKELNKMELHNLSDKQLKVMVIRILTTLEEWMN